MQPRKENPIATNNRAFLLPKNNRECYKLMEIIVEFLPLLKELVMQYGLWQISLAVALPILVFVSPKLLNSVANLIKALK